MNEEKMDFGDWILLRKNRGYEVCERIGISSSMKIGVERIAKSPGDYADLVVVLSQWKSGRTRLVIGGRENESPQVVFDGTEKSGIEKVVENACSHLFAQSIHQNYLTQTSLTLLRRLLSSEN
jgi:hypothetical protein